MTLRTRRIFFWSLIPCFIVGGAVAVLYSQGYRIDTRTHEVTKVGALYVRGYPRDARITLDGEAINTGSWWPLQSGTLDGSLAPGAYKLHAEAPDYRSWDAEVVIRASLVTERKSLVLFPDKSSAVEANPAFRPVTLDTPGSLDKPVLVSDDDNPRVAVGNAVIPGTYVGTIDGRLALLSTVTRGKTTATLLTFQSPGAAAATSVTLPGMTGDAFPSVQDDSVLYRASDRLIYAYDDAGRRTTFASTSADTAIGSFRRTAAYDAWEEDDGSSTTLVIRRRGTDNLVRLSMREIESIQDAGSSLGVLDAAGSLWLVNPGLGTAQEVGHRSRLALWKNDGSAVASVTDDDVVEVIALKQDAPHGRFAAPDRSGILSLAWYRDGEHLFVETRETLAFADVIEGTTEEQHAYRLPLPDSWSYSPDDDVLYVVNDGTVEAYAFPD